MKIQNVSLTNFKKTARASYEFQGLNVITGGNFAGKTSVVQAIQLAIAGFLPSLGKTAAATFQLASASPMAVALTTDDGKTITRTWRQAGKTVKLTTVGDPPALNILAAEDFTAAKPDARLAMLASYAGAAITDLDDVLKKEAKTWGLKPEGDTSLEMAESLDALLADEIKGSKARRVQFEKGVQSLVELAASPPEKPADLVPAIRAAETEFNRLKNEADTADSQVEAYEEARANYDAFFDTFTELTPLEDELDVSALSEARGKAMAERANWDRERDRVNATLAVMPVVYDNYPALLEELEALQAEQDWNAARQAAQIENAQVNAEVKAADRHSFLVGQEIKDIEAMTCCPTCGADGQTWKAKKLEQLQAAQAAQEQTITDGKKRLGELTLTIEKAVEALKHLERLPEIKKALEADAKTDDLNARRDEIEQNRTRLFDEIKNLDAQLADAKALKERNAARVRTRDEYNRLAAAVEAFPEMLGTKAATLRQAAEDSAAELDKVESEHDAQEPLRAAWQAHLGREQDITKARLEAETEGQKQAAMEESRAAVAAVVKEQLQKLFAPVIEIATEFSKGLLDTPLTLHPTTGQIGRFAPDGLSFLPWGTLSGAEQMVATACLQVAFGAAGGGIVILDEFNRMTERTKDLFLARLEDAHAKGMVQQAIVLDHNAAKFEHCGWNIINVE